MQRYRKDTISEQEERSNNKFQASVESESTHELEYEQLKEYIEDNNKNDNIQIYLIYKESNRYVVWWDDYSISLVNSIDGIEKEGMNYYLITNNTPYGSFFY